jgi:hypothetical protein
MISVFNSINLLFLNVKKIGLSSNFLFSTKTGTSVKLSFIIFIADNQTPCLPARDTLEPRTFLLEKLELRKFVIKE